MERHEDLMGTAEMAPRWMRQGLEVGAGFIQNETRSLIWGAVILVGICGAASILLYGIPNWTRPKPKPMSARVRGAIRSNLQRAARLARSTAKEIQARYD